MLERYRCLDLCDEKGFYAGKLLGDMGADVIKVERPGGDTSRMTGPFRHKKAHPEGSLHWFAFNVNKRGITLDIETTKGQDTFRRLASTSNVIIESFPPGYLDRIGLGYDELKQVNPKIILASITPFGQNGPYKDYKTSDLVSMSLGGITWLTGDPDGPPTNVGGPPQAFLFAGTYAAIAALIALYYMETSGEGQHVDVSIQQCLVPVTLNAIPHWTLNANLVKRAGNRRAGLTTQASQRQTWRCKDGYVTLTIYGGPRGVKTNRPLVQWMETEGMAPDYLKERDWASLDFAKVTATDWEEIEKPIAEFFLKHTKAELFEGALQRGLMLFPVYEFKDLLSDSQLKAREFWASIEHPVLGDITCPGAFAKCSESPVAIRRPAPAVGQHNLEIYRDEPDIPEERLPSLKRSNTVQPPAKALEGVRVIDFTWSLAGPLLAKLLADYGATVIHVESATHPEFFRVSGPYKDRVPGINRSGYFVFFAANKYSLALNLNHPEAHRVTRRLIAWGDIIIDNFTPGVMARHGLDYESVCKIKPDIIALSISQLGQTGPLGKVSGTGTNLVGMAGFTAATGFPGKEPVQPFGGYPDFISGALSACALIASLLHHKHTGKEQMIDVSQLEAAVQFLASSILNYTVNGEEEAKKGNRCDRAAPNGVFPCRGDDRWCAITVKTEEEWSNFCKEMGNTPWTERQEFSSFSERKKNEDELDQLISQWTINIAAEEVMDTLQRHGVAAGVVNSPRDIVQDSQLKARHTFWKLAHREIGDYLHLGELFRLPSTPAVGERPAPCLGEHTEHVCRELIDMPEEEFIELLTGSVFE